MMAYTLGSVGQINIFRLMAVNGEVKVMDIVDI